MCVCERDIKSGYRCAYVCVGLLADGFLINLHAEVAREYETIYNTKCFIINSKITAL